ncbi:MAG: helix-turn-helix transcriptional regulator [Ilumatobacteraceae bacterium]|nr:helix-turn-helix transcriptional regulator [Ilumatobacteraceae bacterium]
MPTISPVVTPPEHPARCVLATNVIRLRRKKGWSQEALALECGLHRTFIAHVERQSRNISLDNIDRIASALGIALHELLTPDVME